MLGHNEVLALAQQPADLEVLEKYSGLRMWRAQAIAAADSAGVCWG